MGEGQNGRASFVEKINKCLKNSDKNGRGSAELSARSVAKVSCLPHAFKLAWVEALVGSMTYLSYLSAKTGLKFEVISIPPNLCIQVAHIAPGLDCLGGNSLTKVS